MSESHHVPDINPKLVEEYDRLRPGATDSRTLRCVGYLHGYEPPLYLINKFGEKLAPHIDEIRMGNRRTK